MQYLNTWPDVYGYREHMLGRIISYNRNDKRQVNKNLGNMKCNNNRDCIKVNRDKIGTQTCYIHAILIITLLNFLFTCTRVLTIDHTVFSQTLPEKASERSYIYIYICQYQMCKLHTVCFSVELCNSVSQHQE